MSQKAERGGQDFDLREDESTSCSISIKIDSKHNRNTFKKYVAELIRVAEKIRQLEVVRTGRLMSGLEGTHARWRQVTSSTVMKMAITGIEHSSRIVWVTSKVALSILHAISSYVSRELGRAIQGLPLTRRQVIVLYAKRKRLRPDSDPNGDTFACAETANKCESISAQK
jgi:hypothetical protein